MLWYATPVYLSVVVYTRVRAHEGACIFFIRHGVLEQDNFKGATIHCTVICFLIIKEALVSWRKKIRDFYVRTLKMMWYVQKIGLEKISGWMCVCVYVCKNKYGMNVSWTRLKTWLYTRVFWRFTVEDPYFSVFLPSLYYIMYQYIRLVTTYR